MKRAFSLIEVVVVMLVLAVAVPPSVMLLQDATAARADAINTTRATAAATGIVEHILADMFSDDESLGFAAFANEGTYLDAGGTGLRDRIDDMFSSYRDVGFEYDVDIGNLVDSLGIETGEEDEDIYRQITVTVTYPSAAGEAIDLAIRFMVTDL